MLHVVRMDRLTDHKVGLVDIPDWVVGECRLEGVEHIRSARKETFYYGTSEKEDRWKLGHTWL